MTDEHDDTAGETTKIVPALDAQKRKRQAKLAGILLILVTMLLTPMGIYMGLSEQTTKALIHEGIAPIISTIVAGD